MIHLTHTGYFAGVILCRAKREPNGDYAHAIYAPLSDPNYRARCCPDCLRAWIASFDADEEKPSWSDEFTLNPTTPDDLRRQAMMHADALRAEKEAARRAYADGLRAEFALVGSTRPADQNPMRQTLF